MYEDSLASLPEVTIYLIYAIFMIVVYWKLFRKANRPGWAAIIPIYNVVVYLQIAGLSPWFILLFLAALIPLFGTILMLIFAIYFSIKIAQAFGKGVWFGVGVTFLPFIFITILAFGNAKYQLDKEDTIKRNRKDPTKQEHDNTTQRYESRYSTDNKIKQENAAITEWYKAAEQGDINAQYNLGSCYYHGVGTNRNYAEAVKWYRKAAEQGHPDAQYLLGSCYFHGWGAEVNQVEAVKWYRKAAEQGNSDAQYKLCLCYFTGNGIRRDEAEALRWCRKAADQGHPDAKRIMAAGSK
jgi:TPR repeat protein